MKDLKYLSAYSIPVMAICGLLLQGPYTFLTPVYAFVLIPVLEIVLPLDAANLSDEEYERKRSKKFFDWLLYLNVPMVYGILLYTLYVLTHSTLTTLETAGLVFSTGIVLGSNGINVAHELGHRNSFTERTLAKILLLPSLYMHFYMEHNFGHHLHAATKEDPATARFNQSVYSFWFTSVTRQYFNAWKIQEKLLKNASKPFWSIQNDMFWYSLFQFVYLVIVFLVFGWIGLSYALACAVIGFLLLETINYIEHYGLLRQKKPSGRYERVSEKHSWNSNHIMGRVVLYELTRHSDHHFKASKKYQLLNYHDISPQMPFGYPTSMVLSLFPPLWFRIMNPRIPVEMKPGK
ncbi:alkane 1-monooxygenase [Ascidiimonas aurantiaca]|uniref:alkane 1-monooxygenase n=1 Tax=Ascidiimonas aurantiaca TaxID=1685432 RepID=UPI0030EBD4E4